jgi:ribosomal protein S18 acetylase RimI-like enzyme
VAELDGRGVGLVGWRIGGAPRVAEITVLVVAVPARGCGVGRALIDAAVRALREAGVPRAWLVTTNDNLRALALYQKAGWRLSALRAGAVDEARRFLKPSIPEIGADGIPLRDEVELAFDL